MGTDAVTAGKNFKTPYLMSLRKIMLWFLALTVLLSVCVLGDIISLGERLSNCSKLLGIMYYCTVAAVFAFCLVIPVLKVLFTPEINGEVEMPPEKKEQLRHTSKESAKLSMLLTTISQNGSIDILANTVIAFRLIGRIVRQAGYRPSIPQLIRLYASVIKTSWLVSSADELIDDLDITGILNSVGVGAVCKIIQPFANGAANAYTCLRIGYATIHYLEVGSKRYISEKKSIRRLVAKEARRDLPSVVKSETADIAKRIVG